MTTAAALLEFHPTERLSPELLMRIAALYGAILYALPTGMLDRHALAHDLQPRRLIATLIAHPVVSMSAASSSPIESGSRTHCRAGECSRCFGSPQRIVNSTHFVTPSFRFFPTILFADIPTTSLIVQYREKP